ncbi:MAG: hypothetical protein ACRCWQ_07530 [Bacilli bacterium]
MKKSEFKELKKGDVVEIRTLEELKSVKSCRVDHHDNAHVAADNGKVYKIPNVFLGKDAVVVNEYWSETAKLVMVCGQYHVVVVRQHLKGKTE